MVALKLQGGGICYVRRESIEFFDLFAEGVILISLTSGMQLKVDWDGDVHDFYKHCFPLVRQ